TCGFAMSGGQTNSRSREISNGSSRRRHRTPQSTGGCSVETREAFQLLTLASARDGRTVDASVAAVWADDLAEVALLDAVEAAKAHYRRSAAWLMPVHILDFLRDRRRRELPQTMSEEAPESCANHRWMDDGTCLHCN